MQHLLPHHPSCCAHSLPTLVPSTVEMLALMQKVYSYNNQKWYLLPYFPQAFKCPCGRHEHPPSTLYPTLLSSALIIPQTSLKNPACRPHERPYPHNNPTCNRQQYDKVPPASSALSLFILVVYLFYESICEKVGHSYASSGPGGAVHLSPGTVPVRPHIFPPPVLFSSCSSPRVEPPEHLASRGSTRF